MAQGFRLDCYVNYLLWGNGRMIIFHEGLPRSGKSYEALITHIIPSIAKGRKVFARINGLNYEKIAELTDKTVEEVNELLVHIPEDRIHDIHDLVENDSMVIIDELQNFFPTGRAKLSEGITKFVTEHGHRGLDIVTMGQSIADCHNLWRRRTQRKIQFLKLDMVGADNRYKWTAFQGALNAKGDVGFTKIKSGTKKYDTKYFGAYASHESGTDNTDNYADDRLNIFKTSTFKYILPIFLLVVAGSIYFLSTIFSGEVSIVDTKRPDSLGYKEIPADTVSYQATNSRQQEPVKTKATSHGFDFLFSLNDTYQSQITYLDQRNSVVLDMIIVWHDRTGKVIDRLNFTDFVNMGYKIIYLGYGVQVENDEYKALYRYMPRYEPIYSMSQNERNELKSD